MKIYAPPLEYNYIMKIAKRVSAYVKSVGGNYKEYDCELDLTLCNANGCKLDLKAMWYADDIEIMPDIYGIRKNIDPETGKLLNGFVPVFKKPEEKK